MESIKIENLSFAYPNQSKKAINNISLLVERGEFVTICGKSGCGKSTLLRHIKPQLTPNGEGGGKIYFEGKEITELSQREQTQKIGFVFQNPDNQLVTDTVWHELAFGLESLSYSKSEIRTRVSEMASFFGIGSWFYKKVEELSGGQKQLLNLAAVMVMQPSLIVLDEPTSQLDTIAAQSFLETVYKINRELGVTVILSEHRLEDVFAMSDRVIVMDDGAIIANDIPSQVGEALYKSGNDMFYALPTPMRVYYSKENGGKSPVNVRDARKWLSQMPINKGIGFEDKSINNTDTVLSLSDVWFRYEKNSEDILKGLSLDVKDSELYAIVGSNGSGKTTMLSVIAGLERAYRGKVKNTKNKKIVMLPQNPQNMFVRKTVLLDLYEMLDNTKKSNEQKETEIQEVIEFCELCELLNTHPYDLSGGEQQRVALAKVLLTKPDILLLDEPTKGLDAHFKKKLANMLKELQRSGVTILMVSHDIEFCAKYADRCGMFFDGIITSEGTPRKFFGKNSFYTTAAAKIARGYIDGAVLDEDIIKAIGGEEVKSKEQKAKPYTNNIETEIKTEKNIQKPNKKRNISKRTVITSIMILLLIPFTIFVGGYFLENRKYQLISLLVIVEAMLPFALIFENRKPHTREIVVISVLCGIAVAGRCAFYMLPHFKPVVALVIISGVCFGGETGFLVGAITAFVSNFFFGQTPLTPWQMFAFGITGFLSGMFFKNGMLRKSKAGLCSFGFLTTLVIYGLIMNTGAVLVAQPNPTKDMLLTAYALGLPSDLVHATATAIFLFFIAEPMMEKIDRIKTKYKIGEC